VHSDPHEGTTFTMRFPRCAQMTTPSAAEKAKPLRGGTETILLVEDAAPLRELTRRLLQDLAGIK